MSGRGRQLGVCGDVAFESASRSFAAAEALSLCCTRRVVKEQQKKKEVKKKGSAAQTSRGLKNLAVRGAGALAMHLALMHLLAVLACLAAVAETMHSLLGCKWAWGLYICPTCCRP